MWINGEQEASQGTEGKEQMGRWARTKGPGKLVWKARRSLEPAQALSVPLANLQGKMGRGCEPGLNGEAPELLFSHLPHTSLRPWQGEGWEGAERGTGRGKKAGLSG